MTPHFRIALVVLLALPALVLLLGCASGVRMTDEEAIACRDAGCTAWTDAELLRLATAGYRKVWTDANHKRGGTFDGLRHGIRSADWP